MEKDLCRTIVKRISTGYAHDRIQRAQQLFEQIRLCDCMAIGGKHCACVRRPREVLNGRNKTRDKGTQTEERTGKCLNQIEMRKIDFTVRKFNPSLYI